MHEIPASLAAFATRELRGRGMEIRTNTRIDAVRERRRAPVDRRGGAHAHRCAGPAGVEPAAGGARPGPAARRRRPHRRRRLLRVQGSDNVWAIGDAAAVPDPAQRRKAPCPPTAQHALRQGRVAADNVAGPLAGRRLRQAPLPDARGVRGHGPAQGGGHHARACALRGFPAWFAARTYHLAMMPGIARRLRLMADWTVGLFFGRASAGLGHLGHPTTLGEENGDCRRGRAQSGNRREPTPAELTFREGRPADLRATFDRLRAGRCTAPATRMGVLPAGAPRTARSSRSEWQRRRELLEFMAAQPGSVLDLRGRRARWSATATCARSARWRS